MNNLELWLRDETVVLRPWQVADLPTVERAGRHPEITGITTVPAGGGERGRVSWLARQNAQLEQGTGVPLAIIDPRTGTAIGHVGLASISWRHARASLGYWVLPDARRRGAASAAVGLLVPWAFRTLELARIEAEVESSNGASRRVLERAGFHPEGLLRSRYRVLGRGRGSLDMLMHARLHAEPADPND